MRTPVVAGNWKMNLLGAEAVKLVEDLKPLLSGAEGVEVVVCPIFTCLRAVADALHGTSIEVGGQNCYSKESGAFTGEISPAMLLDAGCTWTIVGHSERRQFFRETDEELNAKVKFALASGLNTMFCVGETLEERENGVMNQVLDRQILKGLEGLGDADFARLVMAYEPVWAIGTGVTATPEQAEEAHDFVRSTVRDAFGETVGDAVRIQYGGSVKPDNAADLMGRPNVDGALVGGASLDADSFAAIVKAAIPKKAE